MRRLVVATFAVALALSLTGCGGSSSSSSSAPAPAPAAAPAVAVAPPGGVVLSNRSENETDTFIAFPASGTVPASLNEKINVQKQPTLIYFFDSSQYTSKEVRKIIDTVRDENRGMVDLVAYDIGKFVEAAPNGAVTFKESATPTDEEKQALILARDPAIDVSFTPFIVLTDSQGYIIYKHRGLVDRAFLEREIQRASR